MTAPRSGVPDPREFRYHRAIGGGLAAGAAVTIATPVSKKEPVAGAARVRIILKMNQAGTLDVYGLHPDQATRYDTKLDTVAIVANTELVRDIDPHAGEATIEIVVTPSATGTITYAHIMQV